MNNQTTRLIENIRRVARKIGYQGRADTRILACVLDHRRIRPPKHGADWRQTWLRATNYGEIKADTLSRFLRRNLPELYQRGCTALQAECCDPSCLAEFVSEFILRRLRVTSWELPSLLSPRVLSPRETSHPKTSWGGRFFMTKCGDATKP